MDNKAIVENILALGDSIKSLTKEKKSLEEKLILNNDNFIKSKLAEKDYGCGSVSFDIEGYKVTVNVPKKVKYDQLKLGNTYNEIKNSGYDPEDYISVEYSISENAYKNWPEHIQNAFLDARTVEQGNLTIKIEERE